MFFSGKRRCFAMWRRVSGPGSGGGTCSRDRFRGDWLPVVPPSAPVQGRVHRASLTLVGRAPVRMPMASSALDIT